MLKTSVEFYESAKKQNPKSSAVPKHTCKAPQATAPETAALPYWWQTSSQYNQQSWELFCADTQWTVTSASGETCPQSSSVWEKGTRPQNFSDPVAQGQQIYSLAFR